jgi:hypothetical protein
MNERRMRKIMRMRVTKVVNCSEIVRQGIRRLIGHHDAIFVIFS